MNNIDNNFNTFQYYIYLPQCNNVKLTVYYNINSNKSKNNKKDLKNFFLVETDNYYFEIINPPDEYGYFTLNNNEINGKRNIQNNNYILEFFVTNKDIIKTTILNVNYSLSFGEDEAYKKECQIGLIIIPCYNSCNTCSKDVSDSNQEQHNCIECRENYYPSPLNTENCYLIEEKEKNWYFDNYISQFALCNEKCESCSGPNENECTSCYNDFILDNGRCKCKEGYYPDKLENHEHFQCYECYDNCKTCLRGGNHNNMECETCKDDYIKYNNNCYKIKDSTKKTFYEPEDNNVVSSCKQKFGLYILEESNECIELPEIMEGYYISNSDTGIISKCHENCFSCNNGPKKDGQGNLESMECSESNDPQSM